MEKDLFVKYIVEPTLVKQKFSTLVAFSDLATTNQSSLQPVDAADELKIQWLLER